jgi:hypothetical protein
MAAAAAMAAALGLVAKEAATMAAVATATMVQTVRALVGLDMR